MEVHEREGYQVRWSSCRVQYAPPVLIESDIATLPKGRPDHDTHMELVPIVLDLEPLNELGGSLLHPTYLPQVQDLFVRLELRELRDFYPDASEVGRT